MELLDGVDLETLVTRHGPVEPARAIHFLRQACDSLAEAHELGLVHRDVKPANMIAQRSGRARDSLKVLDFGLVALGVRPKANDPKLTDAGVVVRHAGLHGPRAGGGRHGRPARRPVRPRLRGLLAPDRRAGLQRRVAGEDAHRPRAHGAGASSKRFSKSPIPADLEAVIMACLAKDPAERPQSADELDRRLAACLDAGRWTSDRARAWWDQHSGAASPPRLVATA